ncbi:toll-like receptor 13 [Mytilus galloprovincialis]|uniref:Toll-like receptor 13 n=1 Tax=Mytilus galloprovincialis TaxID=29158 RepID=A0A8B6GDZ0_MYTGA|nr:toll-like receptor 13 [Mytilus galloprovincialis]
MNSIVKFYTILVALMIIEMSDGEPDCKIPCYCKPKQKTAACASRHLHYIPKLPSYVEQVKFVGNNFTHLSRSFFKNITSNNKIILMNLTDNLVLNISVDAFADFQYLKTLEISKEEKLTIFSLKKAFRSFNTSMINNLIFSGNEWEHLPPDMFKELKLSRIRSLSMTSNSLKDLNGGIYSYLTELKTLNLAHNEIKNINLSGLIVLEELVLIDNDIHNIPTWCNSTGDSFVPQLKVLRLESNSITEMNSSSFKCLRNLQQLRVDYNNFRSLKNNTFSELVKLDRLHLSHITRLQVIQETAFNVPSLKSLYFQYNGFHFDKGNKFNAKTIFSYCPNLTTLDMSSNFLPSMKKSQLLKLMLIPLKKLEKLTLPDTKIRGLPIGLFPKMKFLKTLNLQGNSINGWKDSERIFGNKSSLKTLNLQANNIRLVNKTTFPPSILSSLKSLDLSSNQFSCTCDQIWFREWIRENFESKSKKNNLTLISYPEKYACMFPSNLRGVLLKNYNPTPETCKEKNYFTAIAVSITLVVVLLIAVPLLLYRCQTNVRNYIYWWRLYKKRKSGYMRLDSEDYEYHAFVVYCEQDRKWVHDVLVKKLENEEDMRICIHHREFDIGAPITGNIGKYMSKCRKIVVVMSNDFAESEWCQWEVDLVQERRRKQGRGVSLLIMLHTIDSNHMTDSLKTLLDSTPHLQYSNGVGEKLFWTALVEGLRKPFGHPPVAIL